MMAKEYLYQAYRLDQQINSKLEQVARLKHMAMQATGRFQAERISGTPQHSPMEEAVIKLVDLEYEINDDIDRLVDLKREMTGLIAKISNPSHRVLLELRYFGGNTWEDISSKMSYDLSWVFRLHGRALQEVELVRGKGLAT